MFRTFHYMHFCVQCPHEVILHNNSQAITCCKHKWLWDGYEGCWFLCNELHSKIDQGATFNREHSCVTLQQLRGWSIGEVAKQTNFSAIISVVSCDICR